MSRPSHANSSRAVLDEPEPPRLPWPMAALSMIGLALAAWLGAAAVVGSVIALCCGWP